MDAALQLILSNGLIAVFLALVAATAARWRVNPAVVHVLWLLVLAKLVAPPIALVGIRLPSILPDEAEPVPTVAAIEGFDFAAADMAVENSLLVALSTISWQQIVVGVWILGSVVVLARSVVRVVAARRLLRQAEPVPAFFRELAEENCRRLGMARCPELLALAVHVTPAVWSLGWRPRVVFPDALIREMDRDRLEALLVHELAHVRRRDYLVRLVELAATVVFWWHPVVWWARTQLREMEERCCDRIVLRTVPHGPRAYATALVETLDFLSVRPGPLPIGATAASPTVGLMRRIEMLKHDSDRPFAWGALLLGAAFFLPGMALALADDPEAPEPKTELAVESQDEGTELRSLTALAFEDFPVEGEKPSLLIAYSFDDAEQAKAMVEKIKAVLDAAKKSDAAERSTVAVVGKRVILRATGDDQELVLEALDSAKKASQPKLRATSGEPFGVGQKIRLVTESEYGVEPASENFDRTVELGLRSESVEPKSVEDSANEDYRRIRAIFLEEGSDEPTELRRVERLILGEDVGAEGSDADSRETLTRIQVDRLNEPEGAKVEGARIRYRVLELDADLEEAELPRLLILGLETEGEAKAPVKRKLYLRSFDREEGVGAPKTDSEPKPPARQ